MDAQSLGQIAYDAYGEHQAWVTYDGRQMPSWESVRPDIKNAWERAGKAVALAITKARHQAEAAALEPPSDL